MVIDIGASSQKVHASDGIVREILQTRRLKISRGLTHASFVVDKHNKTKAGKKISI
jgi:hypothetical protein